MPLPNDSTNPLPKGVPLPIPSESRGEPLPPPPRRLSEELCEMVATFTGEDLRLRDLMDRFQGRVYTLFLILLCLPFCQPIALPGLSTPFGFIILLLGFRFAVKRQPWLPGKLLDIRIPAKLLLKVVSAGAKMLGALERVLKPRASWVFSFRSTQFISGLIIAICGTLLLLPLPVPLSNLLPAAAVILVAASISERDGAVLLLGIAVFLITLAFFAAIFFGGAEAMMWLKDYLGELFSPGEETLPFELPQLPLPTGNAALLFLLS